MKINPEVKLALQEGKPVIALESTIISHGMPYPKNVECALQVEKVIRDNGAIPATIGIIEGEPIIGMTPEEIELFGKTKGIAKVSRRDLPIVVANKMDEENAEENLKVFREKVGEDVKVFPISAIIHEGVDQVLYAVADALETAPKFDMEEIEENTVVYNFEEEEAPFVVHNLGNGQWTITGKKIERIVSMTSLVSDDAIKRLSIKMRNMGIDEALRNAGCQDGDTVSILDFEFEFYD